MNISSNTIISAAASGVTDNVSNGITNGIAWNNKNYVLRYAIGV